MKNTLGLGMLVVALVTSGRSDAQAPLPPAPVTSPGTAAPFAQDDASGASSGTSIAGSPASESSAGATGDKPQAAPQGFSPLQHDYLAYLRPCGCCGPVGKDGPILYEVYTRHGFSAPLGNSFFGEVLKPGYTLQAGGRTLFFDASNTMAWTADLGIRSTWYDVRGARRITQFNIPRQETTINPFTGATTTETVIDAIRQVTPSSYNQTAVHLSIGNEWYLSGPASCCADSPLGCRLGYDLGGIWGSSRVVYREIMHGNDVIKGVYLALHADVECPYKCCVLFGGIRTEFSYTRSQILQGHNDSNLAAINGLANFGIRW